MMVSTTRRSPVLALVLLAGLVVATAAAAGGKERPCGREDGPGDRRGDGPRGEFRELLSRLDLTAEQRADVREILQGRRAAMEPLAEQVAAARRELAVASHATPLDEGAVRAAADRLAGAQAAVAIERGRALARVREVLTPEQRRIADRAFADGIDRMGRGGRDGRGPRRHRDSERFDSF